MFYYIAFFLFALVVYALARWLSNLGNPFSPSEREANRAMDAIVNESVDNSTPAINDTTSINNRTENTTQNEMSEPEDRYDAKSIMFETLQKIGCQPVYDENDNILVAFQGENFLINCAPIRVTIWDLGWAAYPVDHPNFPLLLEAINSTNFEFGPTVVYSQPDEENKVWLHSRMPIVLLPDMPEKEDFIRSTLENFFFTKEKFRENLINLLNEKGSDSESESEPETETDPSHTDVESQYRVPSGIDPETGNFVYDDTEENSEESSENE